MNWKTASNTGQSVPGSPWLAWVDMSPYPTTRIPHSGVMPGVCSPRLGEPGCRTRSSLLNWAHCPCCPSRPPVHRTEQQGPELWRPCLRTLSWAQAAASALACLLPWPSLLAKPCGSWLAAQCWRTVMRLVPEPWHVPGVPPRPTIDQQKAPPMGLQALPDGEQAHGLHPGADPELGLGVIS